MNREQSTLTDAEKQVLRAQSQKRFQLVAGLADSLEVEFVINRNRCTVGEARQALAGCSVTPKFLQLAEYFYSAIYEGDLTALHEWQFELTGKKEQQ